MRKFISLTRRNCLVFLRDRSAVFFSLLSMFIILMLMGVFLGDSRAQSIVDLLAQFGGDRDVLADKENAIHLSQYWNLAGIMVVNAITVTLSVIGVMIHDTNENKLESFYSAPIGKAIVAISYITSAIIVGILFCTLTIAGALVYIISTGGAMISAKDMLIVLGYTVLIVCIFSILMFLCALFVKSSKAWSGLATIVGTLVGFAGAIYVPVGGLPEGVTNILKWTPILHGTTLMRNVLCKDALTTTFNGIPEDALTGYMDYMGISIQINDTTVSSTFQVLFLTICGIVTLVITVWLARRKNINDR